MKKINKMKEKFPIGSIVKHKACSLIYEIVDYRYQKGYKNSSGVLQEEFVSLKVLYYPPEEIGKVHEFYMSYLNELRLSDRNYLEELINKRKEKDVKMKNEIIEIKNNQPELIYGVGLCEYIDLEKSIKNLDSAVKNLAISFMEVGKYLKEVKEHSKFKELGFESIYELTELKYGFSKTTTKNFISVFEKFGSPDAYQYIKTEYRDYNFSQLVELVSEKENIDDYSPLQTVKEIRLTKLSKNVESDKTKVDDWFNKEVFEGLKKKYKNCSITIDTSGWINVKYKKQKLGIYIRDDYLVGFYDCSYIKGFKNKETIMSFKLICMEIDRYIRAVDKEIAEEEVSKKETITTTTIVHEVKSSPISDHLEESEDEYNPEEDPDINQDVPEEAVVEVIDVPAKVQKLKNNKAREEFIKNEDNYSLLYDLKEVNARIYQHKEISYIYEIKYYGKFYGNDEYKWRHASYHMIKPSSSNSFGYCLFNYSEAAVSIIVEHLKDIKY